MDVDDRLQLRSAGLGAMGSLLIGLAASALAAGATPDMTGASWSLAAFVGLHLLLGLAVALLRPGTVMAAAVGVAGAWILFGILSLTQSPLGAVNMLLGVLLSLLTMAGGMMGWGLRRVRGRAR